METSSSRSATTTHAVKRNTAIHPAGSSRSIIPRGASYRLSRCKELGINSQDGFLKWRKRRRVEDIRRPKEPRSRLLTEAKEPRSVAFRRSYVCCAGRLSSYALQPSIRI